MGEGGERTESATPKRRGEARKRGQVAKSHDMSSIVVLLGVLLAVRSLGSRASALITHFIQDAFTHLDDTRISLEIVRQHAAQIVILLVGVLGPLFALALFLGTAVNMAQTGPLWAPESLRWNFNRLNPLTGAKRFVSPMGLVNLGKSLYKIMLVGYITYITLQGSYPQLIVMTRLDIGEAVGLIGEVAYRLTLRIAGAMLVMSVIDYFYQRYSFEKSIKMTKQEVKQEMKNAEGSPLVKGRMRARMRQMAKKRMMEAVPTADVVITNPTHFAVALKYEAEKNAAPVVVAKGADYMALKIREVAQMNDVPIMENPPLARVLYKQVDLGREIPADLYAAVAEALAFVYQVNQKRRERMGFSTPRDPFARNRP